jgi:hypothetical protein
MSTTEPVNAPTTSGYPATLQIDYQDRLSRVTTIFRLVLVIPIAIILGILTSGGESVVMTVNEAGDVVGDVTTGGLGILGSLFLVTLLLLLFRKKYPKWWFDFNLALHQFAARISAYVLLITDRYPSTDEYQNVHLEVAYPNAQTDLNRGLPLVKWFLAIPHYFILFFLSIAAFFVVVIGWFAIIFVGRFPRGMFNFVVGVMRWWWRVQAYAFVLATDKYPPFSLD